MYRRLGIYHIAFSSCGALSIMKQDGFQLGMHDNIFDFKGFNHSSKSSTIYWLVMIDAKGAHMRWTSKPIKMNKWNFMSLVPNVACIEITPSWPHENIDWHWIGIWMPIVNGAWIPLTFLANSWKEKTSSKC